VILFILWTHPDANLKAPVGLPIFSIIAGRTGTLPVVHTPQVPP
jgi:hypothetical protein